MIMIVIVHIQIMKAAISYETVLLVVHTLNIIENGKKKLWNVFTSNETNVGTPTNKDHEFILSGIFYHR